MRPVDQIRSRLRAAGYHPVGEACFGARWLVELHKDGQLHQAPGPGHAEAWQGALRLVESLGVVIRGPEEAKEAQV